MVARGSAVSLDRTVDIALAAELVSNSAGIDGRAGDLRAERLACLESSVLVSEVGGQLDHGPCTDVLETQAEAVRVEPLTDPVTTALVLQPG